MRFFLFGLFLLAAPSLALAQTTAPQALAAGGDALVRGDLDEAERYFIQARDAAPQSPLPLLGLADIARRRGNDAETLRLARAVRALPSEAPEVTLALARLMVRVAPPDEALATLDEAIGAVPQSSQLPLLKALLLRDLERVDAALAAFEQAFQNGVEAPGRVRLEVAAMLLDAERPEAALKHLQAARELLPQTPEVYYRLAAAERALGRTEEARQALETFRALEKEREAAEQTARDLGMGLNEAQELASKNQLPEALARVDALLEQYPPTTRVLVLRAKILYSLGRFEEAVQAIVRARDLDPKRVEPHYLEGVFRSRDDPEGAKAALRRALELAPGLAEARQLLEQLEP